MATLAADHTFLGVATLAADQSVGKMEEIMAEILSEHIKLEEINLEDCKLFQEFVSDHHSTN